MEVRAGLSCETILGGTVKVALVKQDAKKRLSKLSLPRDVDSIWLSRWRSTGIRLVLGASLWKFFQNSRGELILFESD